MKESDIIIIIIVKFDPIRTKFVKQIHTIVITLGHSVVFITLFN